MATPVYTYMYTCTIDPKETHTEVDLPYPPVHFMLEALYNGLHGHNNTVTTAIGAHVGTAPVQVHVHVHRLQKLK